MCGRAIALNKLSSHENWCKHLECSHGAMGSSIAARFRAFDKNTVTVPMLLSEGNAPHEWIDVEERGDMAPLNLDTRQNARKLVPLTSRLHWHAVMFHQLILEDALGPKSVLAQELVVLGLKHFGLRIEAQRRFIQLFDFQIKLSKFSLTFETYCKEHVNVLTENGEISNANADSLKSFIDYYAQCEGLPTYERLESEVFRVGGVAALNSLRIVLVRKRQLMRDTLQLLGYGEEEACSEYVTNVHVTCCPFCDQVVYSHKLDIRDTTLVEHLRETHGEIGEEIARVYLSVDSNECCVLEETPELPKLVEQQERNDHARGYDVRFDVDEKELISLELGCIDWRALMLDNMLSSGLLSPSSVLTQEIVVIGLFYFGLVNQRSPQKFGQYPQLQKFQKRLHDLSSSGYDLYCGAGIKEGELGSSHTRGRPVPATKDVVRRYHHYGLSHKSLQRNDRKRNARQSGENRGRRQRRATNS